MKLAIFVDETTAFKQRVILHILVTELDSFETGNPQKLYFLDLTFIESVNHKVAQQAIIAAVVKSKLNSKTIKKWFAKTQHTIKRLNDH